MHDRQPRLGWLEVICGSMFSGKTEEMIRRVRRARIAKQNVQVFKPAIDNRYAIEEVKSHNGLGVDAIPVGSTAELLAKLKPDTEVIGIDEIQFFDAPIVLAVQDLANRGVRVIAAGTGYGFSRRAVWLDAAVDVGGRARRQAACDLRGVRRGSQPHPAPDRWPPGGLRRPDHSGGRQRVV